MDRKNSNRFIKGLINDLVSTLNNHLKSQVNEEVKERMQRILRPGGGGAPLSRKGHSMIKICPVPKCKKTGSPRHSMLCIEHSQKYDKKKAAELRFEARQPGGKWYVKPKKKSAAG